MAFASTTLKFAMATMTVAASTTLTKTTAVYRHLYFIANVICPLSPLDLCSTSEYECSNGYCIQQSQRCDGYNDCWDNSDEYCSTSG